jgi:hypothetical protein
MELESTQPTRAMASKAPRSIEESVHPALTYALQGFFTSRLQVAKHGVVILSW